MTSTQVLPPALRRRFQTGRMSLDLTHTGGEGEYARWELLHDPADIARFLGIVIGTEAPRVRRADVRPVLELRAAITSAARTVVAGGALPGDPVAVINQFAAPPPLLPQLDADGDVSLRTGTVAQAASTIARDAIELFGSPLAERIRVCAADDCGLLFVDQSRPGRRRWCSMEWCGDRAKKRAAGRAVHEGDRE